MSDMDSSIWAPKGEPGPPGPPGPAGPQGPTGAPSSGTVVDIKSIQKLLMESPSSLVQYALQSYVEGKGKGGSMITYDPTKPKSAHNGITVFSRTVPWNTSVSTEQAILNILNGVGETDPSGSGCYVRNFAGPVQFEFGGVLAEGADETSKMQKVLELTRVSGYSVEGLSNYVTAGGLILPTYRTEPPVYRDFTKAHVYIEQLTFTGTVGTAFLAASPASTYEIGRLIGPGQAAATGLMRGIEIAGLGDSHGKVRWLGGFTNGIDFNFSYSNSIEVGWLEDCIRGVNIEGNQNRVLGGHIGGGFVTSAINPLSCEIGVNITKDSASNIVESNVEYCRRSATASGIQDRGVGNKFLGYTESCAAYNILSIGKDSHWETLAGGTNVEEGSTYFAGGESEIKLRAQQDFLMEAADAGNGTLAFAVLQTFAAEGGGRLYADRGFETIQPNNANYRNEILDSSNLLAGTWFANTLGTASWTSVRSIVACPLPNMGYDYATRMVFPAKTGDTDIYRIQQSGKIMASGPISFGAFIHCTAGEVEVMVKLLYSVGANQCRTMIKTIAASNTIKLASWFTNTKPFANDAIFEISFRSRKGATIEVFGAHLLNTPRVKFPVVNIGGEYTSVITGQEIEGNTAYNGLNLNGVYRVAASPVIAVAVTLNADSIKYPIYLVSGAGAAYNITLGQGREGQMLTLKRTGAAGTVNIICSSTLIDGVASMPFTTAYTTLRLIYSSGFGWLTI